MDFASFAPFVPVACAAAASTVWSFKTIKEAEEYKVLKKEGLVSGDPEDETLPSGLKRAGVVTGAILPIEILNHSDLSIILLSAVASLAPHLIAIRMSEYSKATINDILKRKEELLEQKRYKGKVLKSEKALSLISVVLGDINSRIEWVEFAKENPKKWTITSLKKIDPVLVELEAQKERLLHMKVDATEVYRAWDTVDRYIHSWRLAGLQATRDKLHSMTFSEIEALMNEVGSDPVTYIPGDLKSEYYKTASKAIYLKGVDYALLRDPILWDVMRLVGTNPWGATPEAVTHLEYLEDPRIRGLIAISHYISIEQSVKACLKNLNVRYSFSVNLNELPTKVASVDVEPKGAKVRYDELVLAYSRYTTDPELALSYPAMTINVPDDVRVFLKAFKKARDAYEDYTIMQTAETLNTFAHLVDDMDVAFNIAENTVRTIGLSVMSEDEQRKVREAQDLLFMLSSGEVYADEQRNAIYRKINKLVGNLVNMTKLKESLSEYVPLLAIEAAGSTSTGTGSTASTPAEDSATKLGNDVISKVTGRGALQNAMSSVLGKPKSDPKGTSKN